MSDTGPVKFVIIWTVHDKVHDFLILDILEILCHILSCGHILQEADTQMCFTKNEAWALNDNAFMHLMLKQLNTEHGPNIRAICPEFMNKSEFNCQGCVRMCDTGGHWGYPIERQEYLLQVGF